MEASVGNRLRNSHMFLHRNCGRHAMRNVNVAVPDGFQNCRTIYCALEQSAQIGARTGSHSMARQQCKTIIVAAVSVAIFGAVLSIYTAFIETDPEKSN